jgi:hypothetical protein
VIVAFGALVSFQITVLKVLAGQPGGRASIDDLKRAVAILMTSGPEWRDRTKRLAARAGLDIFCQAYVSTDATGWSISDAGRVLLDSLETLPGELSPTDELRMEERGKMVALPSVQTTSLSSAMSDRRPARRRRAAA